MEIVQTDKIVNVMLNDNTNCEIENKLEILYISSKCVLQQIEQINEQTTQTNLAMIDIEMKILATDFYCTTLLCLIV